MTSARIGWMRLSLYLQSSLLVAFGVTRMLLHLFPYRLSPLKQHFMLIVFFVNGAFGWIALFAGIASLTYLLYRQLRGTRIANSHVLLRVGLTVVAGACVCLWMLTSLVHSVSRPGGIPIGN